MNTLLSWIKSHKKLTILLLVVLLLLGGFLIIRSRAQQAMSALADLAEETAFVERRSIQSSVSSTGEIISDNTRSISGDLTGLKVLTVDVEVGDIVSAGDALCTFDTEDLEGSLEDAEKTLSAAKTQSSVSVDTAERALEMAIETKNYQIESAARSVISAHEAYDKAYDSYRSLSDDVSSAKSAVDSAEAQRDAVADTVEGTAEYAACAAAQQSYNDALTAYNSFTADPEKSDEENAAARDALLAAANTAAAELSAKELALNSLDLEGRRAAAQASYDAANKAYETAKASLSSAESGVDSAWNALQSAQSTYEYTVASQQASYQNSRDSLKSTKASAGVSTIQQENAVDTYKEQIEKGVLTASISGTVTAVNVKAGDTYAGGAIVTIQDCDALVVSAEIDEYDIADIALGMKAVFKTDSTRDEQLTGEVIFISPTPTQGSDVTYQVKVRIDSDTTRLRLGMNAKLNIILEETGSVLTVPYDAIQQDENGNTVVYAVEHTENGGIIKTAVPVTVGVEGDYYVEISGNISEGMEVSLPTDQVLDIMAVRDEIISSRSN